MGVSWNTGDFLPCHKNGIQKWTNHGRIWVFSHGMQKKWPCETGKLWETGKMKRQGSRSRFPLIFRRFPGMVRRMGIFMVRLFFSPQEDVPTSKVRWKETDEFLVVSKCFKNSRKNWNWCGWWFQNVSKNQKLQKKLPSLSLPGRWNQVHVLLVARGSWNSLCGRWGPFSWWVLTMGKKRRQCKLSSIQIWTLKMSTKNININTYSTNKQANRSVYNTHAYIYTYAHTHTHIYIYTLFFYTIYTRIFTKGVYTNNDFVYWKSHLQVDHRANDMC